MLRTFAHHQPTLASSVYVDETALVIGQVILGEDSSVWPKAVLRGDINRITIGKRTNIQDGSIIHVTHAGPFNEHGFATEVGDDVIVGHNVVLHGCSIQNHVLIGIGAIIMDGVTIESNVIVAAGSMVPPNKTLTAGLWLGAPAKRLRDLTTKEYEFLRYSAAYYVRLKDEYIRGSERSRGN